MASPRITVKIEIGDNPPTEFSFESPFQIGRADDAEVCIKNEYVSRRHVQVAASEDGQWWIRDLNSSNGMYFDGQVVPAVPLTDAVTVRLGVAGPLLHFALEQPPPPPPPPTPAAPSETVMVSRYISHYFDKPATGDQAGEHTMFVRRAFQTVQKKEKRKYGGVIAILALCILSAGGYAWYEHRVLSAQKSTAEDLFYAMKSLDVDISNLEKILLNSSNPEAVDQVNKFKARRRETEKNYDRFLATLHVYDPKMTQQQRLVLRIARIFGECEIDMPKEFETEIGNYIKKWQSTDRLTKAIHLAQEKGYTSVIAQELLAQDLPPQFFYLALQESGFDPYISGPPTYKGIAKGMWQFVPETAVKYGLHLGPLVDLRRPDPGDDRHHYDRATKAAGKYLRDLYSTDAQASGFLVMASYNWGEGRVLPLIRSLPENPRERNFWRLLALYKDKIPQETYDYVFYIASAAVIGEDPRLFGFHFDNPLMALESK